MKMTDDRIAQLSELGFSWDKSTYLTKTFDEKIQDLKAYKAEYGSCNVEKKHDSKLYQFCATARHSRKNPGKAGTIKLTKERIAALDAIGFDWKLDDAVAIFEDEEDVVEGATDERV